MEVRSRQATVWMMRMEDMGEVLEVEVTAGSLREAMVEVSRTTGASVGTTEVTNTNNSNTHNTNNNHSPDSLCSSNRWEVCTEMEAWGRDMVRICTACREDTGEVGELLCSILRCTVSLRSSRDMEAMEGWDQARATTRWDMEVVEVWLVCRDMEEGSNNLQQT